MKEAICHDQHLDVDKFIETIRDFFDEHKHFILPIISQPDGRNLIGSFAFPSCYSFNCNTPLTLEDMHKIVENTDLEKFFIEDLRKLLDFLRDFPSNDTEKLSKDIKVILNQKQTDCVNFKFGKSIRLNSNR